MPLPSDFDQVLNSEWGYGGGDYADRSAEVTFATLTLPRGTLVKLTASMTVDKAGDSEVPMAVVVKSPRGEPDYTQRPYVDALGTVIFLRNGDLLWMLAETDLAYGADVVLSGDNADGVQVLRAKTGGDDEFAQTLSSATAGNKILIRVA